MAAGLLAGASAPSRPPQAAQATSATRAPTRSDDLKSKVSSPFSAVTKRKSKTAPGRPSPNGGKTVGIKSKQATARKPAARPAPAASAARQGQAEARDAQLVLARIEPWSVMKFSFMLSLIGWIVLFVVVAVFYFLFSALGVFHSIEQTVGLVTSSKGNAGTNAASWFSAGTVLGYTMIAGAIDVVLITALATFGAAIYNVVTRISGGIEVTLQEAD